jgi:hypothetical protein
MTGSADCDLLKKDMLPGDDDPSRGAPVRRESLLTISHNLLDPPRVSL